MDVPFECLIPRSIDDGSGDVDPAAPALFGHGLLGDHTTSTPTTTGASPSSTT